MCEAESSGSGVETEELKIVEELGRLALAIALAGSYVVAMPWLRLAIRLYLSEYRERQKQLLGMKASVLSTWEIVGSVGAVVGHGGSPAQLAGFSELWRIFLALFEQPTGDEKLATAVSRAPDR